MTYNNQNLFTDMDLLDGFISDDLTPYVSDSAPPFPDVTPTFNHAQINPASLTPGHTQLYQSGSQPQPQPTPAKVGGRFTRESVRILKNWLATHQNHPYPREPDRKMLQEETGLTKTQISNWLANARRRGKIPSSASSPGHSTKAMDIPPRPGTPAVRNTSEMDPLQRWVDSPPEDEPAAVTAIARAVASVKPSSVEALLVAEDAHTKKNEGLWQQHTKPSNALFAQKHFEQNTIGNVMKTRYTYHSSDGSVVPKDRVVKKMTNRPVQERTFNRKDHLNQHLKLVHNAKFAEWPMRQWKAPPPPIQSRCGFCNLVMENWSDRVHHLADHFKAGKTMADWKGDWGFEAHILELVENSIPPSYFMQNHFYQHARMPTGDEMQLEACRILFASESSTGGLVCCSWLRDLVFSSAEISQQAQFGPMRTNAESRLSSMEISGKNNIFEGCPFETQLQEFVQAKQLLGLSIRDDELREECCMIVGRLEEVSATPSDFIANFFVRVIHSPGDWLLPFRQRTGIELIDLSQCLNLNAMIQDYTRLEQELGSYLNMQRVIGLEPTDEELRHQARVIVHGTDSLLNHTAADDDYWLAAFRQRHSITTDASDTWTTPLRPNPHILAAQSLVLKTRVEEMGGWDYVAS
ncbi:unnamed protein product [Fusarium graminearum]|nr:hypothetical protein HG531_008342 [Fusarium graminearum]CAG1994511.1 unnamed protein product [Fusarium graminearum]